MATGQRNTWGVRRRYKGKMVRLTGRASKPIPVPRAQKSGNHKQAVISYERGQDKTYPTKQVPGKFKVQLPNNKFRHVEPSTQT